MIIFLIRTPRQTSFDSIVGHEDLHGECRYIYTLPLTSALDGVGLSKPLPGFLTPRKESRYPMGGPHGRYGRVWEISLPPVFDPRTYHCVTSGYTDFYIPACVWHVLTIKKGIEGRGRESWRKNNMEDIGFDYRIYIYKGKAIPLQAWTGPEGSRRLRFPDFKTIGTWRW